ncbi:hypothetical protein EC991_007348 [Linnemannia zychae]|nr:hypothetical protein EC991_007348 [Linnemannia zychae]
MANALIGLRVWMALITLANLCIAVAFYAWLVPLSNSSRTDSDIRYNLTWTDVAVLIASPVLFFAYLYSIWGKARLSKSVRAPLMLLPALFLLGIRLRQIHLQVGLYKMINAERQSMMPDWAFEEVQPFVCMGKVDSTCGILQASIFIPVIVGIFTVIEVFVTLFRGPSNPAIKVDV